MCDISYCNAAHGHGQLLRPAAAIDAEMWRGYQSCLITV
jgi:hypothetical protein